MKYRLDFVTNSSSSSFVVAYKVNKTEELEKYMAEEYGKYGKRLLDKYVVLFSDFKENNTEYFAKYLDDPDDLEGVLKVGDDEYWVDDDLFSDIIKDDDYILLANREYYSREGSIEEDDAWLVDHIPEKYLTNFYEQEGCY